MMREALGGREGDVAAASVASLSRLVGGSGGSLAWSRVGGSLRPEPGGSDVPFKDRLDMVEM